MRKIHSHIRRRNRRGACLPIYRARLLIGLIGRMEKNHVRMSQSQQDSPANPPHANRSFLQPWFEYTAQMSILWCVSPPDCTCIVKNIENTTNSLAYFFIYLFPFSSNYFFFFAFLPKYFWKVVIDQVIPSRLSKPYDTQGLFTSQALNKNNAFHVMSCINKAASWDIWMSGPRACHTVVCCCFHSLLSGCLTCKQELEFIYMSALETREACC